MSTRPAPYAAAAPAKPRISPPAAGPAMAANCQLELRQVIAL
jgi:hypothetical protein